MASPGRTPESAAGGGNRTSLHVDPESPLEVVRHYIRDLIYGANDGLITTFAVVAGVAGGALSLKAVLVVGAANLFADGLSMGVGNFLSIRAHESARAAQDLPEEEARPLRHAIATFFAFVVIGAVPLLPYLLPGLAVDRFAASCFLTLATLFVVGASRALVTADRWWAGGLEMASLGVVVAAVAYGCGAHVASVLVEG